MDLLIKYKWLSAKLADAVGAENVRPHLLHGGNTLLYSYGPKTNQGWVLAEHRPVDRNTVSEYKVIFFDAEAPENMLCGEPYSLNADPYPEVQIDYMIQQAKQLWQKEV